MELKQMALILVGMGVLLIAAGGVLYLAGSLPFLGKLPGDIRIEREHFRFYFPLGACLLLSLLLSLLLAVLSRFR